MDRTDGYAAIRDYALIGDGRTSALVARDGSIDWFCLPDADSEAVFARILDARRGGSFRLQPQEPFEAEQAYEQDSNVLTTTFRTASGTVRVTDAMLLTGQEVAPLRELVRLVEGLSGSVPLTWTFEPRFGYGARVPRIDRRAGRWFAVDGATALALGTWGAGDPTAGEGRVTGTFEARAGETALLAVDVGHKEPAVLETRANTVRRLERTRAFWPRWVGGSEHDGPWSAAVHRSALVLKLLVYSPSGAIVAAPTASLPEAVGGVRNWDYRFTWLRDATWTIAALMRVGFRDEANSFFWWLMHAAALTLPRLEVLYRIDGGRRTHEDDLDHLDGYRGSRPVRVGNGAAHQLQLDVYGAVLDAAWRFTELGGTFDRYTGGEIAGIADYVTEIWHGPDSGIWEVRDEPRHFTQSKAMCWVALDRAWRLAEKALCPDRSRAWRAAADEIRAFVETRCLRPDGAYGRSTVEPEMDASLLTLVLEGFHQPDDPRLHRTVDAVRAELAHGPFVRRYLGEDGIAGGEGAFLTCSFWLAESLARLGRVDEAAELFEELLDAANHVGLYAEEIDPGSGAFLGNFPQALTHLQLINAACTIGEATR